jgi:hypothetical protein
MAISIFKCKKFDTIASFIQYFFFTIFMFTFSILLSVGVIRTIDIESLQNRLLKVCYAPATSAGLPRVSFFFSFLFFVAAAINSTNEANKAGCTHH